MAREDLLDPLPILLVLENLPQKEYTPEACYMSSHWMQTHQIKLQVSSEEDDHVLKAQCER